MRIVARPTALDIVRNDRTAEDAASVIGSARKWNEDHGFFQESTRGGTGSWWSLHVSPATLKICVRPMATVWTGAVSQPLGQFLKTHFPKELKARTPTTGNVGAICVAPPFQIRVKMAAPGCGAC
jgi:hypothetical protein